MILSILLAEATKGGVDPYRYTVCVCVSLSWCVCVQIYIYIRYCCFASNTYGMASVSRIDKITGLFFGI